MFSQTALQRHLPVLGASVRSIIIFSTVLSIPLAAAEVLELTPAQTSSWILALYGLSALLSLILTARYRQPILLTGNIFVIIFISRLGDQIPFPELVGAAVLAGLAVFLVSVLGIAKRLATWIPMPIVFGLLAGAVMPFVADIFTRIGNAPLLIGGVFVVYLASRRLLGDRIPAILPALLAGLLIGILTNQFGQPTSTLALAEPVITRPVFSLASIIAATPIFLILITLQANLPTLVYLKSQGYDPPEATINTVSGLGTMLGSLLGPTGISLSLPATSIVAGPDAGDHAIRHRSIYIAGGMALAVGILAGFAADLPDIIPLSLLLALAGLSVLNVLVNALQKVTEGPLILGPLFAFAVALSEISLLGFGAFFWALVIGTGVSFLLERDALRALQSAPSRGDQSRPEKTHADEALPSDEAHPTSPAHNRPRSPLMV